MSDFNDDFSDFDDFDDTSFGGDDAGGNLGLTTDQEKRLEKFQKNVKQATRVLNNPNSSVANRVKAAKWLGESGEPTAITSLRQAYRNDSDKKVKQAAEYSLGMFRALEEALDDPKRADEVGQILQDIIFKGKIGGVSGAAKNIRSLQALLFITFLVLMGIGLLVSAGVFTDNSIPTLVPSPTPFVSPTPLPAIDPIDFVGDLLQMHDDLVFDAELLAERYQLTIKGEGLGCDVTTFRAPDEYIPPEGFRADDFPLVKDFIDRLNTTRTDLEALRVTYDDACASQIAIPVETANEEWNTLIPIQTSLNTEFLNIIQNPDFIPGESIATATPRPSPTPFPTATVEPSVINNIILQVRFNLDDMNQPINGKNNRLIQFWTDLELGGRTDGCRDGAPDDLPANYVLTEQDRIELPADLVTAIDSFNLGMQLSRDSWNSFEIACASDNPNIQQGKSQAGLAKVSFDEANSLFTLLTE